MSSNPFEIIGARFVGWNAAWVQRDNKIVFDLPRSQLAFICSDYRFRTEGISRNVGNRIDRSPEQESQAVTAYDQYSIAIAVHNNWAQETSGSVKYDCEK